MDFKDPKTQKILLVSIGVVGILYLYFFSTFLPFGHRAVAAERAELPLVRADSGANHQTEQTPPIQP